MSKREKRSFSNSILRIVFVGISVLLQAGWILLLVYKLSSYSTYINIATSVLAVLVVLRLYSRHTSSAMKMPWIMLILVFPVMGLSLYLMTVLSGDLGSNGKRLKAVKKELEPFVKRDCHALQALEITDAAAAGQCHYLQEHIHAPVYQNTSVQYFSEAANAFDAMKEELEKEGIACKVLPRKALDGKAVSASTVRVLVKEGRFEELKELVPEATYRFFTSEEAEPVIRAIRGAEEVVHY